ncbi:MAG: preprotein translocase subunit YajC [Clostridiaceae bacterium]|jgi:preprotein translocase subunit YajC|nr:preprotein translocase subunit YajC [Clostridiaceae bacterium]
MQFLLPFLAEAAADVDPNATGAELTGASSIYSILILIVPLVLMYLILIVPQRRRDKKMRELINSTIVGDEIVTIGGLCGKIVNIKDDEVTFESSIERTKVTIKKWGIKEVKKPVQA